jgi:hypothetical protein
MQSGATHRIVAKNATGGAVTLLDFQGGMGETILWESAAESTAGLTIAAGKTTIYTVTKLDSTIYVKVWWKQV